MASIEKPQRNTDFPDLASMTREELIALDERIDRELESRAFEERLRREVEYHMRKQHREQRGR
ncbi:hypothetical protein H0Z60_07690 [Ectothiorhodospiraceae bacterium WFHF3C12]|nr:hypothetical protein [Ectothiorhodospiraceae bacterium WFHF3C12]